MKKNNKKSITSLIILSILLIVSLFGLYYYFDLNQMNLNKIFKLEKDIEVLERNNKVLNEDNTILKISNATLVLEKDRLREELNINNSLKTGIVKNEYETKRDASILIDELKIVSMDIGKWELTNEYKNEIINKLNKEIYFYEIIPIVDNKNYLNDSFELKQLGLTRKRASVAVTLLKSLNKQNKIYLSTDIIVSDKNERGFIIKRFKMN